MMKDLEQRLELIKKRLYERLTDLAKEESGHTADQEPSVKRHVDELMRDIKIAFTAPNMWEAEELVHLGSTRYWKVACLWQDLADFLTQDDPGLLIYALKDIGELIPQLEKELNERGIPKEPGWYTALPHCYLLQKVARCDECPAHDRCEIYRRWKVKQP